MINGYCLDNGKLDMGSKKMRKMVGARIYPARIEINLAVKCCF